MFFGGRTRLEFATASLNKKHLPPNYFYLYFGAEAQNRTGDTRIFSPLLYQLSYLGTEIIVTIAERRVKESLPYLLEGLCP